MAEVTLSEALQSLAHELVARLDADAAILSRVLGDVLLIVSQTAAQHHALALGQGFLVSDFPQTKRVIETGEPLTITLDDPDLDPAEASVLRELGYATLLMLPLELGTQRWGLVEVYRTDVRPFDADDIATARELSRVG